MGMKYFALVAIVLLLVPMAYAKDDDILLSDSALINLELTTSVRVIAEKPDYSLSTLTMNLSMLPAQYSGQEVQFTNIEPSAAKSGKNLLFLWNDAKEGLLNVKIEANIATKRILPEIRERLPFPTTPETEEYTLPTKNIDSDNREIIKVASDLAAGENDLYKVVSKLAEWTNENVEYNLSTLTEGVSQPASWVLVNRRGVCDDISSLFIALNRALGIQARFVSGLAYTNSPLFADSWGFHGWAEVYFPGYGWVPFDVTYGEYGYTDAGHIRFTATADPADATTRYEWRGRNVRIVTSEISSHAEIAKIGSRFEPDVQIIASPFEHEVGFGSYNAIEADVTNLRDYYITTDLAISKTEDIELLGPWRKPITLEPLGETTTQFVQKVSENLNDNYVYTFPVTISAENVLAMTNYKASSTGIFVPLDKLQSMQTSEKSFNPAIKISCSGNEVFVYEKANITCTVINTGNVFLNRASVCLDNCEYVDLGIMEKRNVSFLLQPKTAGRQRIEVKATSDSAATSSVADFMVLDEPNMSIEGITLPASVKFGQKFNLSFTARKASYSEPKNIEVKVTANKKEYSLKYDNLSNPKKLILAMNGNALKEGINVMPIHATYEDRNGRGYEADASANVTLNKLNFFEKILAFILRPLQG
jgi:transglutaminase-like putative cysteine protease